MPSIDTIRRACIDIGAALRLDETDARKAIAKIQGLADEGTGNSTVAFATAELEKFAAEFPDVMTRANVKL